MIWLGLDGGGSSLRALAVDDRGESVFSGQSGPANLISTSPEQLAAHFEKALAGAPKPDAVCGCFAGLLTDTDRDRAKELLTRFFPDTPLRIEPDYAAALAAEENVDLCVVAGTGSIICSKQNGKIVKSGGLGYLLGDEGSGFAIGKALLTRYLRQDAEISKKLQEAILNSFGSTDDNTIVSTLYRSSAPAAKVAKVASEVGKAARQGDPIALQIVEEQMTQLAKQTVKHVEQFLSGKDRLRCSLSGGLWKSSSVFGETFLSKLGADRFELVPLKTAPVMGAVRLAKEILDVN